MSSSAFCSAGSSQTQRLNLSFEESFLQRGKLRIVTISYGSISKLSLSSFHVHSFDLNEGFPKLCLASCRFQQAMKETHMRDCHSGLQKE